ILPDEYVKQAQPMATQPGPKTFDVTPEEPPKPNAYKVEFLHSSGEWLPEITTSTLAEARKEAARRFKSGVQIWRIRPYYGEISESSGPMGSERVIKRAIENPPEDTSEQLAAQKSDFQEQLKKTEGILAKAKREGYSGEAIKHWEDHAAKLRELIGEETAPVVETPAAPAGPDPLDRVTLAMLPLKQWMKVTKTDQLPTGYEFTMMAKRLGVKRDRKAVLEALHNEKRLREIFKPFEQPKAAAPAEELPKHQTVRDEQPEKQTQGNYVAEWLQKYPEGTKLPNGLISTEQFWKEAHHDTIENILRGRLTGIKASAVSPQALQSYPDLLALAKKKGVSIPAPSTEVPKMDKAEFEAARDAYSADKFPTIRKPFAKNGKLYTVGSVSGPAGKGVIEAHELTEVAPETPITKKDFSTGKRGYEGEVVSYKGKKYKLGPMETFEEAPAEASTKVVGPEKKPAEPEATPVQAAEKELYDADQFTSQAASAAEKATVAWATHVEDVVKPLKEKIRQIQAEVSRMEYDANRTKITGKNKLTKKAFLELHGVASIDEAQALYKKKNADWADLEKQLEEAEAKRKELEAAKERRSKEWSAAATRAGELRRKVYPDVKQGDVGGQPLGPEAIGPGSAARLEFEGPEFEPPDPGAIGLSAGSPFYNRLKAKYQHFY